jgi:hypothetical protein
MWKKTLQLDPDPPIDGGAPPPNPASEGNLPPAPVPADPPAAAVVLEADRTEREIQLQDELQRERDRSTRLDADKKDRETKIAQLEDELNQLRSSPAPELADDSDLQLGFYDFEE